ncbi:MAG: hypothetical protein IJ805_00850 [Lachnospiraceae bacterium]|nr:hypothetical protein [Lachnospiraceae bacterium]
MTDQEMKNLLIDQYCDYQEIKKAETSENEVLEYKIKRLSAKLSSLGVNVEDLTLK